MRKDFGVDEVKLTKLEKIEQEILETIHQWGRVGVKLEDLRDCNTFNAMMKKYRKEVKKTK